MTAEANFQAGMVGAGLVPPETINADGHLHRFGVGGKSCWYVLHLDGIPAGSYGDWKTGHTETWCAKSNVDMSYAERLAMRERFQAAQVQRDAERDRLHVNAAARAMAIWAAARPALDHDYLTRKAIKGHGVRTDGHYLLVPRRDTKGKLWSLQTIAPNGEKRFMPGGRVVGTYFSMGKPEGIVIVCEGFATGATLSESTGCAVVVAFSAGNLMAVAVGLRAKYPDMELTIAADDDFLTVGNPGMTAARAAAAAVGGKLAVPNFDGLVRGTSTDFNDVARLLNEQGAAS